MRLRKKKLILPGVQVRLTLWFVGVTAMSMLLLFRVLLSTLEGMENGIELYGPNGAMDALTRAFLTAFGIGVAVTFATGVLVTHRIAGPLYRFTQFLEAVMRGEHPNECRIRKRDELHDFCAVLNRATEPLRVGSASGAEGGREPVLEADAEAGAEPEAEAEQASTPPKPTVEAA